MDIVELLKSAIMKTDGKGRDDDVPAMLSEGEYVVPADIVSLLGEGNSKAGASILDTLLEMLRGLNGPVK